MSLEYFSEALDQLQDALPSWWAHRNPDSELGIILGVFAELADELAAEIEQIYLDQTMATAGVDALLEQWAVLYGASNEQLPPTVDALRAYLQTRAGDDGSVNALRAALLALLSDPANGLVLNTTTLLFDNDGSGLVFPADGTGLRFPVAASLTVTELYSDHTLQVDVVGTLIFDRPAFARACDRARPADAIVDINEI